MNWENSSAITALKRDFLKAFFTNEKRFFLTGGSALGLFYLGHRYSYDLDFFTTQRLEWVEVDGVVRRCAADLGASVQIVRDAPTFRRYLLCRESEQEVLDFVLEVSPQVDKEKNRMGGITVDTLHEIMLNKITTLIGRSEVKDVVDLYFLEKAGFRVDDYFEEARQKDGGLDPAMISMLLASMNVRELPDYLLEPLTLDELQLFVKDLQRRLALLAFPG